MQVWSNLVCQFQGGTISTVTSDYQFFLLMNLRRIEITFLGNLLFLFSFLLFPLGFALAIISLHLALSSASLCLTSTNHVLFDYIHESLLWCSYKPQIYHPFSDIFTIPPLSMFKPSQSCTSEFSYKMSVICWPSDVLLHHPVHPCHYLES